MTISKVDSNDPDFRGFLCQVRKVGANEPLGRFSLVENGSVEAVTHCDGCKGSVMTCNSSGPGMVCYVLLEVVDSQCENSVSY